MFQQASRLKLRFDSPKGQLTTEDLWDLPLQSVVPNKANLDTIAVQAFAALKSGPSVSFVDPMAKSDPVAQLRFDIVKHVIDTKLTENKAAAESKKNKEQAQFIMDILAQKQTQALLGMSEEDLKKKLAELTGS